MLENLAKDIGICEADGYAVLLPNTKDEDIFVYEYIDDAMTVFLEKTPLGVEPLLVEVQAYNLSNDKNCDLYLLIETRKIQLMAAMLRTGDMLN